MWQEYQICIFEPPGNTQYYTASYLSKLTDHVHIKQAHPTPMESGTLDWTTVALHRELNRRLPPGNALRCAMLTINQQKNLHRQ